MTMVGDLITSTLLAAMLYGFRIKSGMTTSGETHLRGRNDSVVGRLNAQQHYSSIVPGHAGVELLSLCHPGLRAGIQATFQSSKALHFHVAL